MKLKYAREKEKLSEVLKNPEAGGPEIAYWVFDEIGVGETKWEDMTVLTPGSYGEEFPKTYGHYHTKIVNETYKLLSGQGIFMLQKRKFIDDDFSDTDIEEVLFLELMLGEEVVITPEWGHSWINIGNEPLVTFDDWRSGSEAQDYNPITKLRGLCYYFVKNGRSADIVKNPNYNEVPQPKWVNFKEYQNINTSLV